MYLDDDLWSALHARARRERTTVSELVRQAARERYLGGSEKREQAMKAVVGLWRNRSEFENSGAYVRNLRRDNRLERLSERSR